MRDLPRLESPSLARSPSFIGGLERDSSLFGSGLANVRINVSPQSYVLMNSRVFLGSLSVLNLLSEFCALFSKTVRYGLVDKPKRVVCAIVGLGAVLTFDIELIS